jgi:hypothetical protein
MRIDFRGPASAGVDFLGGQLASALLAPAMWIAWLALPARRGSSKPGHFVP